MNMKKASAGLLGAVAMGAAMSASAAGLSLSVLGPLLGKNAFPGTGVYSFGTPKLGGLALALQNNNGHGNSKVGLTLLTGVVPDDVEPLPGLPGGMLQLGLQGPPIGQRPFIGTGSHTYSLPLGEATVTVRNNDGDGHSAVGLGFVPAF